MGKISTSIVWTIIIIVAYIFIGSDQVKDKVYAGNSFTYKATKNFEVNSQSPILIKDSGSGNFFLFQNKKTSELLSGNPGYPKLGDNPWNFTVDPDHLSTKNKDYPVLSNGKWLHRTGAVSMELVSETEIKIVERAYEPENGPLGIWVILGIICVVVWCVGMVFILQL